MNSVNKKLFEKKLLFYTKLKKIPRKSFKHIIEHLDDDAIDLICECVYNVLYNDLNLSKIKREKLKNQLHTHCCLKNLKMISNSKVAVSKRRKAVLQEGEGIGLILSAILPFLTKLFIK